MLPTKSRSRSASSEDLVLLCRARWRGFANEHGDDGFCCKLWTDAQPCRPLIGKTLRFLVWTQLTSGSLFRRRVAIEKVVRTHTRFARRPAFQEIDRGRVRWTGLFQDQAGLPLKLRS